MDNFVKDVRFGARVLARNAASSALSVIALALGIGLTAMMFSIVWGALLRGLPFDDQEQLVAVSRTNIREGQDRVSVSLHDFEDWRAQQRSFTGLAGYFTGTINISGIDRPERFDGGFVSANAFDLLGVSPILGRGFVADDDRPDADRVMLLSYDTWQERFAGDPAVIGQVVRANARPTTIIGVMPAGLRFPTNEQLWVPLALSASAYARNQGMWLNVFGRMRPDVSIEMAAAEMATIAQQLASAFPETNRDFGATVQPFIKAFLGREGVTLLFTMLGAVFMVLLIACANVANLLISRAASRSREVGIRTAMGASTSRIVRQFLTEAVILAFAGALSGLIIAYVGVFFFNRAIEPTDPPFWIDIRLDTGVLLFVLGITLLAAFLAGAIPAWQAARANVADVLKDESRGASSFRLGRISRALVVTEIALSAGLLVGAGLMIKSVTKIRTVEFPFAAEDVFTARVGLPEVQYPDTAAQQRFFEQLMPRLRELSQIAHVGLIQSLPGVGSGGTSFTIDGVAYDDDRAVPNTRSILLAPGAFDALDVQVRQGRGITDQDRAATLPVAVVNEEFARRFFAAGDVIGRRIRLGGRTSEQPWRTIVGVVPNMYVAGLDSDDGNAQAVYVPLAQGGARFISVVARARSGDPMSLTQPVREAVLAIDGDLPIYFAQTLQNAIDDNHWFYMVFGTLFMIFGAVALFLAAVGLYGVMSTSVAQRTREMGVRMALGAQARDVIRLVMRQGLWQLGFGLALGLALALAVSNLLQMLLFEVNPRDPMIFLSIGLVLTIAAVSACLIPAARATRVDPQHALRYD
ncbi:MAG TPA: ABC transporter permease [Longimicrobiales bacterium]|nr:ABC transporter permease [Longimicrobiales bacterium]